ncbi:MAG: S41 family peptidase [Muribaculaceae bacterium]|nr:S41 family peptidase [Muribaculaceae bacterium]
MSIAPGIRILPLLLTMLLTAGACHKEDEYPNDAFGNFDLLWKIIDEHYCYLDTKGIDWQAVGESYRARIVPGITYEEYFNLCAEMLGELRDGHVNLSSQWDTSYYRKWWSDYPQDFNIRTLQEYYLKFDYKQTSGISYKVMTTPDSIGYIYYGSFSSTVGETSLDYILSYLHDCKGLIIDVRNNGGGEMTNIRTFVSRFIKERQCAGYMRHKTGPEHQDYSDPYPIWYDPAEAGRVTYYGPIAVLTNRSCFSATNDFVAIMKTLPQVTIVGARTGGGGGLPFSSELPIGWSVRFSACPVTDIEGNDIEEGILPSEGHECHSPADILAEGRDPILDHALNLLSQ